MRKVLTIAGSDCSGGAGIQADIKTITAHKVYAMSAITALTAQNTMGVTGIMETTPEFLRMQLESIFTDIYPDAVKIGMVSSAELIRVIAEELRKYHCDKVVLDPVMVSTSGSRLLKEDAAQALIQELMPQATLITPNIPEAEVLTGRKIHTSEDMVAAAKQITENYDGAVLIKGGHDTNTANDLLYHRGGEPHWFFGERIDNPNTHGTGCTLSSAIASNLALDHNLVNSIDLAKQYLTGALRAGLDLGRGDGPLDHTYWLQNIHG